MKIILNIMAVVDAEYKFLFVILREQKVSLHYVESI